MKCSVSKGLMVVALLFFSVMFIQSCEKNKTGNIAEVAIPHHPLSSEKDLDILLQEIGDARVVLLGEASHGTAEYYNWRAAISRRLIQEKGFDFIAVEGEWADSYRVNNFIKGESRDSAAAVNMLKQYDRWPTWMWGNYEVASLVTWLNRYNQTKAGREKVGFYGLDVYCLWESMTELMPYLQGTDAVLQTAAQQVHHCFRPFSANPEQYAYAVAGAGPSCRTQTENLWQSIMNYTGNKTATTEAQFVMQQNALVALNGERYYRAMVSSSGESWNIRDRHMMQTLQRLTDFHGADSKVIVWEHNTHVGDARYTDMAAGGMVNVGQLARETYGEENVYIVGFGSYRGSVIAATEWGAPQLRMDVPPAKRGSWEHTLHGVSAADKIILSREIQNIESLSGSIGHRAIGVVYDPQRETGNYVPSVMAKRYDAFVYIDRSTALRPLGTQPRNEPPDTYPSGY